LPYGLDNLGCRHEIGGAHVVGLQNMRRLAFARGIQSGLQCRRVAALEHGDDIHVFLRRVEARDQPGQDFAGGAVHGMPELYVGGGENRRRQKA
jgi:hypothetical protein